MPSKGQGRHKRIGNGAVITHIDWTKNHSVGYANEQAFLSGMATQTIEKSIKPFLFPNKNTVEWFGKTIAGRGSRRRYVKMYAKAMDMLNNMKKNLNKSSPDDYDYYQKLLDYVIQNGVVREEHSFKQMWLIDHGFELYGMVKESDFIPYLQCIEDARNRLEVANMKIENVEELLIQRGIVDKRSAAKATQNHYLMWLHGIPFDVTSRNVRTHKSRLKQLGIDIGIKLDITLPPVHFKNAQVIEVKPLDIPAWYRKPVINPLDNVVLLNRAA